MCSAMHTVKAGSEKPVSSSQGVNLNDTVVFDISMAVYNGNQVSFPVYFLSDDTINALDFSFKFNLPNFTYDTILDLTNYLQETSNFYQSDTTVFFTSYSLQRISNDTPLVSVQLTMHNGLFCSSDLNTVLVYLNGDPCSLRMVECVTDDVEESPAKEEWFTVFQNPVAEKLEVSSTIKSEVQLTELSGQILLSNTMQPGDKEIIDVSAFANGIYFLRSAAAGESITKKFLINR